MTRMASGLLGWRCLGRTAVAKRKIYFEQVPVEMVKKIAKRDFPDSEQDDARDVEVKERRGSERPASGKQTLSERQKRDDSRF
jgi:hypothetical protein